MSAARLTSVTCMRLRSWARSSRSASPSARRASAASAMDTSRPSQRSLLTNCAIAAVTAPGSALAETGIASAVLAWLAMDHSVSLSVIIDGRLDAVRARQVATLTGRLGLAGVWLRLPWWPLSAPVISEADSSGLLASLLASAQVRTGLVLDAGEADAGWLELPAPAALRVALSGEPGRDRAVAAPDRYAARAARG